MSSGSCAFLHFKCLCVQLNTVSRATCWCCPRATGWAAMAPVFRAELFLCFEVGGRQLVCPKLRYLFTKLNAITSYKKVVILWTVNCPMETFDDVCYEIGRFVGWRCVVRIISIQANEPTKELTEGLFSHSCVDRVAGLSKRHPKLQLGLRLR
jgi:hypothetical protein